MIRIALEDKSALDEWTDAGHLYIVKREDSQANKDVMIIMGGKKGILYDPLQADADISLYNSEDAYEIDDTEVLRHARNINPYLGSTDDALTTAWSIMAGYVDGIDAVQYDYELPFTTAERVHVANSNAVIFSALNQVGVDARTIGDVGSGGVYGSVRLHQTAKESGVRARAVPLMMSDLDATAAMAAAAVALVVGRP